MRVVLVALALAAGLCGCMPRQGASAASTTQAPDGHNSRNALDWAGVYEGVLPCADCPGIKTRLVLRGDGSFALTTQYIDRQVTGQTVSGRFTWNAAGSVIALDAAAGGQQYAVGEGRLLQLDRDGTQPPWNTPHRQLLKTGAP